MTKTTVLFSVKDYELVTVNITKDIKLIGREFYGGGYLPSWKFSNLRIACDSVQIVQ